MASQRETHHNAMGDAPAAKSGSDGPKIELF